jgi:gamma-glutamyltranspeptidase/glutathione hydrolase
MSIKGVVAAGHKLTVQAAEVVLREGGNAFDAILAAHFAACAAEPVLASLGGGGFMLAKPQESQPIVYDFFVHTPRHKRATDELDFRPIVADFGTAQQEFHIGQGTIATPGSIKGVFAIHRDLCSMPMIDILAPAIQYAREGVMLNHLQAYIFSIVSPIYTATPETREIFCSDTADSRLLSEGEAVRQTKLADTLEILSIEGADLFYRGEIAQEIVRQCREDGGHLSLADLDHYDIVRRKPLDLEYRNSHVLTNPPPASGGILIAFALELLKAMDLDHQGFGSYSYLHVLAETIRLTNKARVDLLQQPAQEEEGFARLLSPKYLKLYREQVALRAQSLGGTTHMSVMDADGNVASMTVSNGEGCGSMVPNTGIMLNNMLGEQDLNLQGFDHWPVDQRMTSMMAPSLIWKPEGHLVATGSGGSNRIRTALLQVMVNLIDFGMDVETAVVSPRIHLEGERLSVEGGFRSNEIERLITHYPDNEVWDDLNLFFGGAHTVMQDQRKFTGFGDPRRGGACRVVQ